jgi:hypothetical protein
MTVGAEDAAPQGDELTELRRLGGLAQCRDGDTLSLATTILPFGSSFCLLGV